VSETAHHQLLRIDDAGTTAAVAAELDPTPCEIAVGFGSLWVVTQSGRVDRVDPATGAVIARIRVGATSYEATAAFGSVWVTNRNGGSITRIDPATNRPVGTVHVPGAPGGIVAAAGHLWIGNDTAGADWLVRLDPRNGSTERIDAGHRPAYVANAGGFVWVSNVEDGTVTRIDARTGRGSGTVRVGISPVNLVGVDAPKPLVWVPEDVGNAVVVLDATEGRVIGRLDAPGGPAVIAAAGDTAWVSLFEGGQVLAIRSTA
jgi:hypothetical protein